MAAEVEGQFVDTGDIILCLALSQTKDWTLLQFIDHHITLASYSTL